MKLKPTAHVLIAVALILAGVLVTGGGRLYGRITAPRIDPEASPLPTSTPLAATLEPTSPVADGWETYHDGQGGTSYVPPLAEAQALREAFATLLYRVRVPHADEATLLAHDREASIAQARALVAEDYAWPLLETPFVFVYGTLGPENEILCADTTHCRISQAVLGIESVLIFDEAMCGVAREHPVPGALERRAARCAG